jgi:hypothetical protein
MESKAQQVQKARKIRAVFTKAEDKTIIDFVQQNGFLSFEGIESIIKTRTKKQCKERWKNVLSPFVVQKRWTSEEDDLLINLVKKYGNKWIQFTETFPGRTDVIIKNRYSLLMRHKNKATKSSQNIQILNNSDLKLTNISEDKNNQFFDLLEHEFEETFNSTNIDLDFFSLDYFPEAPHLNFKEYANISKISEEDIFH